MKYNYLKWIQLLIATGIIAIETGTDKNAIDTVKHHKAGTARADNGPVVYKRVGKVAKTCWACLLEHA